MSHYDPTYVPAPPPPPPGPSGWNKLTYWQQAAILIGGSFMALLIVVTALTAVFAPPPKDDARDKPETPSATKDSPEKESTPTPTSDAVAEVESPPAVMPEVVGLTRKQAERELAAAGLVIRSIRRIPSAQPVSTVLRQGRKFGTSLPAGAAVVLVIAAPYPRVPSVEGQSRAKAKRLLRAAGFRVEMTTESRTSGRDGVVLRQTPAGANRAKPRSLVTIVVSSVIRPLAPSPQDCTSGYRPCLAPASDYDCAGGSGDGPEYAYGPIYVTGSDPYDLDSEGDGIACE